MEIVSQSSDEKIQEKSENESKPEIKYFKCCVCILNEKYEYFGKSPPWVRDYKLEEDAYIIEDPFLPPKRGEFLILGAHCVKCGLAVCKDTNCSFYYIGTYCIKCAKQCSKEFPNAVQEKLNRIIVPL
ncbi:hypothetical protein ILUMI_04798 [Ignelater luminosus]|uniref:Cysteine-rich DPF motif domain-containing protein 1 n=1 Tax=Ignelater luminosus TaxID=2038154 RepID=A0A8K0DE46_IGNLU|nr:hypothetical protein ILUMI_04798 [Ignelater luminosus]